MPIDEERARELLKNKQAQVDLHNQNIASNNDVSIDTSGVNEEEVLKSLGKARSVQEKLDRREDTLNLAAEIGWKNIPISNLPSEGRFYHPDIQIAIRSASVQEVRHFSSIEEEDSLDINDKLNFVLDKCLRIKGPNGFLTFKDLVEFDRFSIIFAIRELTFKDGENKLQMNVNCNQCGHSDLLEIGKNNFHLFKLDERLKRFYSPSSRNLSLTTKDGEKIELYIPTLGVMNWISNLVRSKRQKNEYIDTAFLKVAPFLFSDYKLLSEKVYNSINEKTFGWSVKKMSIIVGIIDIIQESINPNITSTCSACGSEVASPINFQGGIKGLFLYSNFLDELV